MEKPLMIPQDSQILPIYDITIDEAKDLFVSEIALVNSPAHQSNFLAFNKEPQKMIFSEDKMQLFGAAIIPDLPIYRNVKGKEFYVKFSKETISQICHVFFKKGLTSAFNIEHSKEDAHSYIFHSQITSPDTPAPKGLDVPDGSWVIGVQVTDPNTWAKIKSGELKGYSVEGLFGLQEATETFSTTDIALEYRRAFNMLKSLKG